LGVLIKVNDRNHTLLININHTHASTASVRLANKHGKEAYNETYTNPDDLVSGQLRTGRNLPSLGRGMRAK
jgi:hypothetical protein